MPAVEGKSFETKQPEIRESESCSCWRGWLNLTNKFHHALEVGFYKYGYLISKRPLVVILICTVLAGAFGWGLSLLKIETRTDKLYIPQESRSISDLRNAEQYFPVKVRTAKVILMPKTGDSVFEAGLFKAGLKIFQSILNKTALDGVCIKANASSSGTISLPTNCVTLDPFLFFKYNEADIKNVTDTVNQIDKNPNITMPNGRPAASTFPFLFGKIQKDSNGTIKSARALRFQFYLKYPEDDTFTEKVLKWEKQFIDVIQSLEKDITSQGYDLYYFAFRSVDDSINESTGGDIKLLVITFVIMCTFTCLVLCSFRDRVKGHAMVANTGILAVAFGIATAFGMAIISGVTFISMIGVMPFLVLGVAIDDMFIIVDSLDRTLETYGHLTTREIIAEALSKVGGTVTMTTLTDLVAFAVSTTSVFPAIRYFCTFAALALTLSFIMIMTFFIAFVVYDVKRIKGRRWDMAPCINSQKKLDKSLPGEPELPLSTKIMRAWGNFIINKYVRKVIILLSLGLTTAGILGTLQVKETFTLQMLGTDGSYYIKFLDTESAYFDDEYEISIVVPTSFDLSDPVMQKQYLQLPDVAIASSKYMMSKSVSWMNDFLTWANRTRSSTNKTFFMKSVRTFLQLPEYAQYKLDIKMDSTGQKILATRVMVYLGKKTTSVERKDGMIAVRTDLDKKFSFKTYAVHLEFMFFEQYANTKQETIRNLVICAAAVLVMTAPYMIHPGILLFVCFSFAALIVELLGLMAIWGVSLNSISTIILAMAIGFAVDYSAHIAHAYVSSSADIPEDRMIDAFSKVGASVFMGGFTTLLGMLVTAFAKSEIFRIFFKMMFGIVVLGLLHGLCFLPVYMVEFCRTKVIQDHKKVPSRPTSAEYSKDPSLPVVNYKVNDIPIED